MHGDQIGQNMPIGGPVGPNGEAPAGQDSSPTGQRGPRQSGRGRLRGGRLNRGPREFGQDRPFGIASDQTSSSSQNDEADDHSVQPTNQNAHLGTQSGRGSAGGRTGSVGRQRGPRGERSQQAQRSQNAGPSAPRNFASHQDGNDQDDFPSGPIPDPMKTSVGYIGADSYRRQQQNQGQGRRGHGGGGSAGGSSPGGTGGGGQNRGNSFPRGRGGRGRG